MKRQSVNKQKAAKQFNRDSQKTKAANVPRSGVGEGPMRGGWRL